MPPRKTDDGKGRGLSSSTLAASLHGAQQPSQAPKPLMVISPLWKQQASRATPSPLQSRETLALRRATPTSSETELPVQRSANVGQELGSYITVSQIKAKVRDDEALKKVASGTIIQNPGTTTERAVSAPAGILKPGSSLAGSTAHPASAGPGRTLIPIDNLMSDVCNIQDSLKDADAAFTEIAQSHHRLAEWRPTWPDFGSIRRMGTPPPQPTTNKHNSASIYQENLLPEAVLQPQQNSSESRSSPTSASTDTWTDDREQAEVRLSGGEANMNGQRVQADLGMPSVNSPSFNVPPSATTESRSSPNATAGPALVTAVLMRTAPTADLSSSAHEQSTEFPLPLNATSSPTLATAAVTETNFTSQTDHSPSLALFSHIALAAAEKKFKIPIPGPDHSKPVPPIGIVSPMCSTGEETSALSAGSRTPLPRPQTTDEHAKSAPARASMFGGESRLPFPKAGRVISTCEGIQLLRTEGSAPKSDGPLDNGSPEESNVLTVKWIHQRPTTARSASASKEHTTRFLIPKVKEYTTVESSNRWPSPTPSTPQPWDDDGDADDDGSGPRLEVYEMYPPPSIFPEQYGQPNVAADILREKTLTEIYPRPSTTSVLPRPGRGTSAAFANVQSKIGRQGEKDVQLARRRPETWSSPGGRSAVMLRLPLRSQTFEMRGCPPREVPRPPLRPQSSVKDGALSRPHSRENVSGTKASRLASEESKPPLPPREAVKYLIQEAVKTSYHSNTLVQGCGSNTPGLWTCTEYDRPPTSPTRHEVSVVDVNQQYVHLVENSTTALRLSTASALSDLVWTHRIVPPDDVENSDKAIPARLAKAAEARSQRELVSGTHAATLEHRMEVSPGAFEWITDSLCIKIPGIFDPQSMPIVGPRTLPPEPAALPPLSEIELASNEDSTGPASEVQRRLPETVCSEEDHSPSILDSTPKAQSPLPPLPKPQPETITAPAADPKPSSGTSGTAVFQPLHQRPISAWALETRVPLNSAMRAQLPEPTVGARAKSANVSSKAKGRTVMEPAVKLTETKGRFPEGTKATRDRPVSAVLISRQVVPSTVEVENTESSSYRPNTASTNSTRPGTRLPSAAPRAITLTAVSHGWQSNDQTPSEFGEEEYKLARSGRSTPDIRSVEYGGSLPEVMSEGWFVQNMRREGVLAAASEPEAKLPSITAPVQDDGLPCASEPETTTCPSGAEGRDLSTPRKRKKVKKKHRKSRGRRKRDAQKQKMFDTFEDEATDIFGRSCQFEGTDVQNSGRSSRASRPGSSLPGSTAAPVVEDGNPDALGDVEVLEPTLLSRPEKAVDEGMRLILQVKHLVGALQRAMRTHWMTVQHTLYMDMIYIVQRLFRARRVHLQWLRVWALKRSGRSVTLALRQLERMDEAAHIPANGATTLRDLRKPCRRELDSPQSSSADLLAYKAALDPVLNRVRYIARRRLRARDSMARHAVLDVDRSSCLDEYSAKIARVSTLWPEWFELLKSAGVEGRTVGAAIQGEEAYAVLRTLKAEAVSPIPLSPLISYSALTPQSQQASISPTRNGSVSGRQSTTSASGKSKHDGRKSGSRKASRRTSELSSPHKHDRKSSLRNGTAPTRAATAPERTDTAKSSRRTSFAPGISKIDDPSQSKSLGSRRVSYALPADGVTGSRRGSSAAPAGQSRRSSFLRFLTIEEMHLTIESILVTLEDV